MFKFIKNAIKKINWKFGNKWNFGLLHFLLKNERTILRETLPKMVKLALDMPRKICRAIPILKRSKFIIYIYIYLTTLLIIKSTMFTQI